MTQAVYEEELNMHLEKVVSTLRGAVSRAMQHLNDSRVIDNTIQDCKKILDVVMEGKVSEWLRR